MDAIEMFEPEKPSDVSREKDFDDNEASLEEWEKESSRDDCHPGTPAKKRKISDDRQPESPPELERQHAPSSWQKEKYFRSHVDPMDTDSPASYLKHMVDNHHYRGQQELFHDGSPSTKGSVSTPGLTDEYGLHAGSYDHPSYRPSSYYQGHEAFHQTPPRSSRGHFMPEMDTPTHYSLPPPTQDGYMRPRRWACDYCHVATFVSYEEACAHEDACARSYHERYGGRPHPSRGPVPQYDQPPHRGGWHEHGRYPHPNWGRGTILPAFTPEHQAPFGHEYHQTSPSRYPSYQAAYISERQEGHRPIYEYQASQRRMLLAMPSDADSLSDRQCYVRSEMVEIFAATDKDVSARHSKGAQKLVEGQVGIRCIHCAHLRPRDRAERAVCYPSSISRIYQTVADMQRFHFEHCREIPSETRKIYKSLKTTRPRGVGSPQTYWIHSAKLLDLVDTKQGIKFSNDTSKEE